MRSSAQSQLLQVLGEWAYSHISFVSSPSDPLPMLMHTTSW